MEPNTKVKPERVVAKNADEWAGATIRNYWNGAEPLWKAYWLVGVVGSVFWTLVLRNQPSNHEPNFFQQYFPFLSLPYAVWASVAIWRCANNTPHLLWKFASRTVVILGIAVALVNALNEIK